MPGVLVHVSIGVLSALLVYFVHYKSKYSVAIFIGNLLPDWIKFGISALKQGTLRLSEIKFDSFYRFLSESTSLYSNWFSAGFF